MFYFHFCLSFIIRLWRSGVHEMDDVPTTPSLEDFKQKDHHEEKLIYSVSAGKIQKEMNQLQEIKERNKRKK